MRIQDVITHNREAWDHSVKEADIWTVIASEDEIKQARLGKPRIILTPNTPVPDSWLSQLEGVKLLGLAAGGGQQSALLAAAGADVTVFDLSPLQLEQDQKAAKTYDLSVRTIQGSADQLNGLRDGEFDLIVNPVSNCFFPSLENVWKECHRVLKSGGRLMYGFINPVSYLFDFEMANKGEFRLKYSQPFSDIESFDESEKKRFLRKENALEYGHSLNDQLGLLLKSGFVIEDMFEDTWGERFKEKIDNYFPAYINILARKK